MTLVVWLLVSLLNPVLRLKGFRNIEYIKETYYNLFIGIKTSHWGLRYQNILLASDDSNCVCLSSLNGAHFSKSVSPATQNIRSEWLKINSLSSHLHNLLTGGTLHHTAWRFLMKSFDSNFTLRNISTNYNFIFFLIAILQLGCFYMTCFAAEVGETDSLTITNYHICDGLLSHHH